MLLVISFLVYLGLELTPGDAVSHMIDPETASQLPAKTAHAPPPRHDLVGSLDTLQERPGDFVAPRCQRLRRHVLGKLDAALFQLREKIGQRGVVWGEALRSEPPRHFQGKRLPLDANARWAWAEAVDLHLVEKRLEYLALCSGSAG
jgi:hypothetical protein